MHNDLPSLQRGQAYNEHIMKTACKKLLQLMLKGRSRRPTLVSWVARFPTTAADHEEDHHSHHDQDGYTTPQNGSKDTLRALNTRITKTATVAWLWSMQIEREKTIHFQESQHHAWSLTDDYAADIEQSAAVNDGEWRCRRQSVNAAIMGWQPSGAKDIFDTYRHVSGAVLCLIW